MSFRWPPPSLFWGFWASFWPCLSHLPIVICILGRRRGTGLLIFGPILSIPSDKSMYPVSSFTLSRNFRSGPQNTSGKLMYDGPFSSNLCLSGDLPPLSLLVLGFFLALFVPFTHRDLHFGPTAWYWLVDFWTHFINSRAINRCTQCHFSLWVVIFLQVRKTPAGNWCMMVIFHQIYVFPVTSPPFLCWFWASFWPCAARVFLGAGPPPSPRSPLARWRHVD